MYFLEFTVESVTPFSLGLITVNYVKLILERVKKYPAIVLLCNRKTKIVQYNILWKEKFQQYIHHKQKGG